MADYYYVIASLPGLSLEQRPSDQQLKEAWQLIDRQVSEPVDRQAVLWFLYRNDIHNLVEHFQHKILDFPRRPLRQPASINEEDLEQIEKDASPLPFFLSEFYESHRSHMMAWNATEIENKWHQLFFESVQKDAPPFIQQYFEFEDQLRRMTATFNTKHYSFLDPENRFLAKDLAKSISRGHEGLPENLQWNYPFLSELLKALASGDLNRITKQVHQSLWERSESLAKGQYFNQTALLSYCARLFLLFRRKHLIFNKEQPYREQLVALALKNTQIL
jgi:hypothetical protein